MKMQVRDVMVEPREVAGFDQVILRGSVCCAEVYIEQGGTESLIIEAEPDVIPRIETRVRDRKLVIRLKASWLEQLGDLMANDLTRPKMVFRLKVCELRGLDVYGASYVHAPSIEAESLIVLWRGAGSLVIDSLRAQDLQIEQSGAGAIEISGQVERQGVKLSGVGRYDGSGLRTEQAEVRVTGSSFARVHATGTLNAIVHGVGVVEYSGDPQVHTRLTGAGSVVRVR
jgi:hypothetical protein